MTLARRFIARSLLVALALGSCAPLTVAAQTSQAPPITAPTPAPLPTTSGTPIPYPAYGSPAPDVAQQLQKPGVPVTVTLNQAIDIAVVQAPAFASERAVYNAIAAKYGAEKSALLPGVSAQASATKSYGTFGTGGNSTNPNATAAPAVQTQESATLSIQQLIFDGGRTIAGIRSAKESDTAGRDTLLRQLQTLAFNVATAYYTLLEDNASVQSDNALVREFEINEQFAHGADSHRCSTALGSCGGTVSNRAGARRADHRARPGDRGGGRVRNDARPRCRYRDLAAATRSSPPQLRVLSYAQSLNEAFKLRPDSLGRAYGRVG